MEEIENDGEIKKFLKIFFLKKTHKKKFENRHNIIYILSQRANYIPNSAAFIAATFAAFRSLAASESLAWPCPGVTLASSATDENFETGLTVMGSYGIKLLGNRRGKY